MPRCFTFTSQLVEAIHCTRLMMSQAPFRSYGHRQKRADGMQLLRGAEMGPRNRRSRPWTGQEGNNGTCAARVTGRTQRKPEVKEGMTAGFHHPENWKLAVQ